MPVGNGGPVFSLKINHSNIKSDDDVFEGLYISNYDDDDVIISEKSFSLYPWLVLVRQNRFTTL